MRVSEPHQGAEPWDNVAGGTRLNAAKVSILVSNKHKWKDFAEGFRQRKKDSYTCAHQCCRF